MDEVDAAARRWSVGIAFLASHKLSAYNAISLGFLNSLETRWSLISTGNLSRNKPWNRQPGFSSSGRRANMVSMRAVGRRSPTPGWWISLETFCQGDKSIRGDKIGLWILVRGFWGGSRTHDQAAYRDHNLLGKLLDDVIEFGFQLCDLSVSEGSLCMKEPQVGVLCPKIQEHWRRLWGCTRLEFLSGPSWRSDVSLYVQSLRKSWNWIEFNCM